MTHDFFKTVLPPLERGHCYFSLQIGNNSRPVQTKCGNAAAIEADALEAVRSGRGAYFSLGSFDASSSLGRKQTNCQYLKSVWADIDAGKNGCKYANAGEAITDLVRFVKETKLTPTFIVSSGMGLHVYWCFDKSIKASTWKKLASVFHVCCTEHELAVDPARSEDCSSVLRVPGSLHIKTGKTVTILKDDGPVYTPLDFVKKLDACVTNIPQMPVQAPSSVGVPVPGFEDFGPQPPSYIDAEPVVKNCPQILTMGYGDYNQWFGGMTVLKRFKNGYEWAHKLSALDKDRYDRDQTDKVWNNAYIDSPMTCESFRKRKESLCKKCRFCGSVKSPVVLERQCSKVTPVVQPKAVPVTEGLAFPDRFDYPNIPFDCGEYAVDSRGMIWRETIKDANGNQSVKEHVISDAKLFFKYSRYVYEDKQYSRKFIFEVELPNGQKFEQLFDVDKHMTKFTIMKWFYNVKVFPMHISYGESRFMAFMNAYLRSVVQNCVDLEEYSSFGWKEIQNPVTKEKELGYVTGSGLVTHNGITDVAFDKSMEDLARVQYGHAGTLEAWKEIPRMYKRLDQKVAQLFICASFAAPLMKYGTGEAKNAIMNLWSRKSGKGKTHVLRACASLWGHPEHLFFTRKESVVARCRRLAVWANMPAFMDELTDNTDEELADLAYTLVGGLEKHKLKSSGAAFVKTGKWSTISFATANRPFKEALSRQYGETDARLLRVMEYECDFDTYDNDVETRTYIKQCQDLTMENYGLAGPTFIYNIMRSPERLETLSLKLDKWVQSKGFQADERFMAYPLALALQCGRWAVEYGLLDYDMDALEKWVLDQFVLQNRADVGRYKMDAVSMLGTFLHDHLPETLIVRSKRRPLSMPDSANQQMPDKYIIRRPIATGLVVRCELEDKKLYFERKAFERWCSKYKMSVHNMMTALKEQGIVPNTERITIGRYVSWLSDSRVDCFVLYESQLEQLGYELPDISEEDCSEAFLTGDMSR